MRNSAFFLLLVSVFITGCQSSQPPSSEPTKPDRESHTSSLPNPCTELVVQLGELDAQIRASDSEIQATAAEADLAQSEFERASRYGGSEGAERAAPAYQRATTTAANALRAKASLLNQREALKQKMQSMGCQ